MAKTCKQCGRTVDHLWSQGRCYFCSLKSYSYKKKKRSPTAYKRPSPKSQLDIVFGDYIKKRNTTTDGNLYCFTSFKLLPRDQIDAGHFIPRGCMRYRWDEYNVWPQSKSDNRYRGGQQDIYRQNLVQVYGEEKITEMETLSTEVRRYGVLEIRELIAYYEGLIKELKPDLNLGITTTDGKILWRDSENHYICLHNGILKLLS